MFDYVITGAGFAGSVLAERLASQSNKKVLIIDRRNHIGGNAFDYYDDAGILVHKYGAHIFHTSSKEVFEYLSKFTEWNEYQHRVLASVDGMLLPMPINLDTVNKLYGINLTSFEIEKFFENQAESCEVIKTSEDVIVSKIGRDLYNRFFKNYTLKQWDLDPSQLDKSVTARVPTRTNRDDRYFTDSYQVMPKYGYTRMFEKMLDNPNIKIMLNTSYEEVKDMVKYDKLIYTGTIDSFFDYKYGKLPYRSLRFSHETHDKTDFQDVSVVNYPNEQPYTRIIEFKKLTGQKHDKTSVMFEYPTAEGDPYYPIPNGDNTKQYLKYKELADERDDVIFVGRLATYKYYNMDQIVAQALTTYAKMKGLKNWKEGL